MLNTSSEGISHQARVEVWSLLHLFDVITRLFIHLLSRTILSIIAEAAKRLDWIQVWCPHIFVAQSYPSCLALVYQSITPKNEQIMAWAA